MKTILLLLLFVATATVRAQPPALAWARSVGSTLAEAAEGVGVDATGAVYFTGTFRGTVDFDPGPGLFNLTATGTSALYVCKLDSSGTFVWAKAATSTTSATPFDMAVDGSGNVIIGGGFTGTVDFDPDPTATVNYTSIVTQLFILKLSTTGDFMWVNSPGGGLARVQGVAVDAAGAVYATGDFQNTLDFDTGPGTAALTSVSFNDVFACKYDANGAYVWAGRMGGGSVDFGTTIAVDAAGNAVVGGYFGGTADFDPGTGTSNLTSVASSTDGFVVKLDATGGFVWAAGVGGSGTDYVFGLATGSTGDVWATGEYAGTVDFDPGAGTANLTSPGLSSGYILRLASDGALGWARVLASSSSGGSAGGGSVIVDGTGSVYCTGGFSGTADFDPGTGTYPLTAVGTGDGFLSRLNSAGDFLWAGSCGSAGVVTSIRDVAVDAMGQVCVAGSFSGPTDFDLGSGTTNLSSSGASDAFVVKYRSTGTTLVNDPMMRGAGLTLFPNPATGQVVLHSNARMNGVQLRLLDIAGRAVRVWNGVDGYSFTANLDDVSPGMYTLEVATGTGCIRARLVKQ